MIFWSFYIFIEHKVIHMGASARDGPRFGEWLVLSESKPWITQVILNSINIKNNLYKQYFRCNAQEN